MAADTWKRTLLMTSYIAFLCAICTAHGGLSCAVEALSLVNDILLSTQVSTNKLELPSGLPDAESVALAVEIIYTILTWTDGLLVRVDV